MSPERRENKAIERANPGKTMEFSRRMGLLRHDKAVRKGAAAFTRTILNTGIALCDLIPGGAGEVLGVVASVAKTVKRDGKSKSHSGELSIDLTPDVGTAVNWLSETPEFFTGGAFPSYAIPAGLQLIYDVPRMIEGCKQAIKIIRGEQEDYAVNKQVIDEAMDVFVE